MDTRGVLVRRGRQLALLTIAATLVEAGVGVGVGIETASVALTGFGVDSVVEVTAAVAAFWRLNQDVEPEMRSRAERRTLQVVGACFLALAAYVAAEACDALWHHLTPQRSPIGVALAAGSVVVMPLLAQRKRAVAIALQGGALQADAEQTSLSAYLAAILLGGLVLHGVFDWWWADPAAAVAMVPLIAKDGIDSLRGRHSWGSGARSFERT